MDEFGIDLQENEISNISKDIINKASSCRSYLNKLKTYSSKSTSATGLYQSGFKLVDLLQHQDSVQKCFSDILAMEEATNQPNPEDIEPIESLEPEGEPLISDRPIDDSVIDLLSETMQGVEIISNTISKENQKSINPKNDQQPTHLTSEASSKEATIPSTFKGLANKVRFMDLQDTPKHQNPASTMTISTAQSSTVTSEIQPSSGVNKEFNKISSGAIPKKAKTSNTKETKMKKLSSRFFTNKTKNKFTPTHISTTTTTSLSTDMSKSIINPSTNVQASSIPMSVFKSDFHQPIISTNIDSNFQFPVLQDKPSSKIHSNKKSLNPLANTFSLNQSLVAGNQQTDSLSHFLNTNSSKTKESEENSTNLENWYEIPNDDHNLNEDEHSFILSELKNLEKHITPPKHIDIEFFEHQVEASIEGAKTYLKDIDNLLQDIEEGITPSKDETNMIKQHIQLNEINKARASCRALDDLTLFRKIIEMQTTTLEILQSQQLDISSLKTENKKLRDILTTQSSSISNKTVGKQSSIVIDNTLLDDREDKCISPSNTMKTSNLNSTNLLIDRSHIMDNDIRKPKSHQAMSKRFQSSNVDSEIIPAPKLRESRTQFLKRCGRLGFCNDDIIEVWENTKKIEKVSQPGTRVHKVSSGVPSIVLTSKEAIDGKSGVSPEVISLKKILDDIIELSATKPRVAISKAIQTISSYNLPMPNPPTLSTVIEVITNYVQKEDGKESTESDDDGVNERK